jgi:hypothetical protein
MVVSIRLLSLDCGHLMFRFVQPPPIEKVVMPVVLLCEEGHLVESILPEGLSYRCT